MNPFKKNQTENAEENDSYTPGKKKGIVKFVILGIVAAVIIIAVIFNIQKKNAPMPVTVEQVAKGDIEVIVSISGNVSSDETKTYYSDIAAPISEFELTVGDRVNKGEVLYQFNEEELEKMKKQAELNLQQANGSYSGNIEKNAKATDVLEGNSISDINTRLDEITAEIDALNEKITEKTTRMNRTLTDLQKVAEDVNENGYSDSYDISQNNNSPNERTTEDGTQMSLEIQNSIAEVQYAIQNDEEIHNWNLQIQALNEEKTDLTEQSSAEMSALTSGEKSALEAQRELTELESADTIEDVDSVTGGVIADFSGVVTEVATESGAVVTQGAKILTVESTDNVRVDIQISKSDLSKIKVGQSVDITVGGNTYEGEVTKISGAAKNNSSGVPMVDAQIKIKNPDDNIILGVEASNKIHTDKAEGVLVIPYEYIGTDGDGDYVFVIEDGKLARRNVTLGLTTSTDAQITDGLKEGDQIVTTDVTTLVEGTNVTVVEE